MPHNKLAWRYILSRKSTQAINIITGVAIAGMMIGTTALIMVLSVFNGFEDIITGMTGKFNPDIKITKKEGKYWKVSDELINNLRAIPEIENYSYTVEELVLFEFDKNQNFGTLKGVDQNYLNVTDLDRTLILGENVFDTSKVSYATLGVGMANALSIRINDPLNALTVYVPKRKKSKLSQKSFKTRLLYPSAVFSILQEVDNTHVFTRLNEVQELLGIKDQISSIEIKLHDPDQNNDIIISRIRKLLGDDYHVLGRIAQDAAFYKIINIERWVSAAIFSLIIGLISFNLIGALWMIVLDKRSDISVLKSMGMSDKDIGIIFGRAGLFISLIGVIGGMLIALLFTFLHHQVGLIPIPHNFISDRYPLELNGMDFIYTALIVLGIGGLCSLLPARRAGKLLLNFSRN